jgi:linearmycin/streptolysin S transport system ATP-binding protein
MHAATRPEPLLQVRGLSKRYGAAKVVDDLSFTIESGEIFGLLGPNGAGKTTTLSMLCGLFPPSQGSATVGGFDLVRQADQVKRLIGVVPQDLAVYPTLSAYDNLLFFGRMYGLGGALLRERIAEALDMVGLGDRARHAVASFSGGMKRRVNIAAGLLHHPRLLFLDEPTVGVDPQSRNHIFESVLRLNQEKGITIVYTTHYMEEVETLCNRIAIMDGGTLIALDTKENLLASLGGGVLYVGLSHGKPEIIAKLRALPLIEHITVGGPDDGAGDGRTLLRCKTTNAPRALLEIIPIVTALGVQITNLEISKPSLEGVFLHLTGKKLRD